MQGSADAKKRWADAHPEKMRAAGKRHYRAHRAKRIAHTVAWRAANPTQQRNYFLKRHYGITLATYGAMLATQDGVCLLCELPATRKRVLDVDHDAKTGRVRGLLCNTCNMALGKFHHSSSLLRRAALYLDHLQTEDPNAGRL
jgi:Recombination endonuclease VII